MVLFLFTRFAKCSRWPASVLKGRWPIATSPPTLLAVASFATKWSRGDSSGKRLLLQQLKQAENVSEISRHLKEYREPIDRFVVSVAMSRLRRINKLQAALALFKQTRAKGIEQDVVTFNGAISAAERLRDWQMALELFDEMQQCRLKPDVITYSATISACEKGGQWEKALELFGQMQQRGLEPNVMTYNATISACEKGGQWEKALELFGQMRERGLEPNVITYNATISACEKGGQWEKALELFGQMRERGLEPNVITYNATISACEKGGQWEKALELFGQMQERGLEPDVITYNATISACEPAGRVEEARALFLEAYRSDCYPKILSIRGALDLHDLSAPEARTAVRVTLDDLRREPENRQFYKSPFKGDFIFITGHGTSRESGESVLRPAILSLFKDEYKELHCERHPQNPGRLIVSERSLRPWIKNKDSR